MLLNDSIAHSADTSIVFYRRILSAMISIAKCIPIRQNRIPYKITVLPCPYLVSCAKNHDIERRRAVVKLPRAREKEREEDTVCSVVHIIFSRDVISEIHTR